MASGTRERRSAPRLNVDMQLRLHLDAGGGHPAHEVSAQLVDVGADGGGAGLHVPLRSQVMLGGRVSLCFPGAEPVGGIIVSRMGTSRYERLGVRIDGDSVSQLRALADGQRPTPVA